MMASDLPDFDPEFASPAEWAAMYRARGIQVVPARYPMRDRGDKRPALADWKHLQNEAMPQALFDRWYGSGGERRSTPNMGMITGAASRNRFIIDLDEQTHVEARAWWSNLIADNCYGIEPETWAQRTGGGGRQICFEGPADWRAPTCKTSIGVDIRGQGGFAMLPPSIHLSGRAYEWVPGAAPWETDVAQAPAWLISAVEELVEEHGGDVSRAHVERQPAAGEFDAFGHRTDGREDYMMRLVWGAVVDWWRECPIPPTQDQSEARMREAYATYERNVQSRGQHHGLIKAAALEREGRGASEFAKKWRIAIGKWASEVAAAGSVARTPEAGVAFASEGEDAAQAAPLILTAAEFIAGFKPPEYLVDGVIQRGYLYSLTASTGHGKTAVTMNLAQAVARGEDFHGRQTLKGSVLMLAGENPDDVIARYLVLADYHQFNPASIDIRFIKGVVNLAEKMPVIHQEAVSMPDLRLVIVDTVAAYFVGDDSNSNTQAGDYARLLRQLTFLPSRPAVVANAHPVKNASESNLTPYGGGAFLNEVDGNLTLWSNAEKQTTLHWQGKFRGPEFEPLAFTLNTATCDAVHDANGVLMPSVVAVPMSETDLERVERNQEGADRSVLYNIMKFPGASVSVIASRSGLVDRDRNPQKSKVFRICRRLLADKLIEKVLGKYQITPKGRAQFKDEDGD